MNDFVFSSGNRYNNRRSVGIGNILLISVKERTKELGRRALGATPSEVRMQIILESVFLTVVAGIFGIVLGAFVLAGIMWELPNKRFSTPIQLFPFLLFWVHY